MTGPSAGKPNTFQMSMQQTPAMPQMAGPQMGVQPAQPAQPAQPNVFQTSSNLFNQAATGPNINQFMNPYTGMVTQNAMRDLNQQRQMAVNDTGVAATRAGAFGGSRHGVAEALTNKGFAEQGANMFGNLQQQGFNTALQAAQNQQNIQSGLAGQGFGFGQSIQQQQAAEGLQSQQMNQALIDAAKGQFGNFAGAPNQSIQQLMAALGGANMGQQSQTTTNKPGLFNWLGLLGAI
jgi:hypothetical protein